MHIFNRTIANLFGRKLVRKWRLGRIRKQRQETSRRRREEKTKADRKTIAAILQFPPARMKAAEFPSLRRADDVDIHTCELGTWFICRPFAPLQNVIVVGHIVKGEEAIMSQFGGRTCIPERWINRYRLELV